MPCHPQEEEEDEEEVEEEEEEEEEEEGGVSQGRRKSRRTRNSKILVLAKRVWTCAQLQLSERPARASPGGGFKKCRRPNRAHVSTHIAKTYVRSKSPCFSGAAFWQSDRGFIRKIMFLENSQRNLIGRSV